MRRRLLWLLGAPARPASCHGGNRGGCLSSAEWHRGRIQCRRCIQPRRWEPPWAMNIVSTTSGMAANMPEITSSSRRALRCAHSHAIPSDGCGLWHAQGANKRLKKCKIARDVVSRYMSGDLLCDNRSYVVLYDCIVSTHTLCDVFRPPTARGPTGNSPRGRRGPARGAGWVNQSIKYCHFCSNTVRTRLPAGPVRYQTSQSRDDPQISPARFGIRQSISPVDELKSRRPRKSQYIVSSDDTADCISRAESGDVRYVT